MQVYLAIGHLLSIGGLSANPSSLLSIASTEVMSISPEGAKAKNSALPLPSVSGLRDRSSKKNLSPSRRLKKSRLGLSFPRKTRTRGSQLLSRTANPALSLLAPFFPFLVIIFLLLETLPILAGQKPTAEYFRL